MCFFDQAPPEVLDIIYMYSEHMDRVHDVWEAFLSCMSPFMNDVDARTDEALYELQDRAFMHAASYCGPTLVRLKSEDGETALLEDLKGMCEWWVSNYIQEHINCLEAQHPPNLTAQRMIMMSDPHHFQLWKQRITECKIPEAVDVVWNYNMIPEDVHNHQHEVCQRDYFTSVEFELLAIAHRAHMAVEKSKMVAITIPTPGFEEIQ